MLLSITRRPVGGEGRQMDESEALLQAGMFNIDRKCGHSYISVQWRKIHSLQKRPLRRHYAQQASRTSLLTVLEWARCITQGSGKAEMVPARQGSLDTQVGASAGALGIRGKGCCSWGRVFAQTCHRALERINFLWNTVPQQ